MGSFGKLTRVADLPGKLGVGGAEVWPEYQKGNLQGIRDYCEADVVNTYVLYLRFQMVRGLLAPEQYAAECETLRAALEKRAEPHWKEFLSLWKT